MLFQLSYDSEIYSKERILPKQEIQRVSEGCGLPWHLPADPEARANVDQERSSCSLKQLVATLSR